MNSAFGMFGNSAQWSEKLRFTDRNRLWTGNKYRAKIKAVNPSKAPPAKKSCKPSSTCPTWADVMK